MSDIVDRLNDDETYVDAIDDAIDEIERLRAELNETCAALAARNQDTIKGYAWRDNKIQFLQDLLAVKVNILDKTAFEKISPAIVVQYLAGAGWRLLRSGDGTLDTWVNDRSGHLVWVPTEGVYADYGEVMGRVVTGIAEAEARSQLQVLRDLYILEGALEAEQ